MNLPVINQIEVTAYYGQKNEQLWKYGHQGVDFISSNPNIYSTCDGIVRVVDYDKNGWGNYITIGDDNGYIHIYAHLSMQFVNHGERVKKGDLIGIMGATGNVTGKHLHYQINTRDGVSINPCKHLGIDNKKQKIGLDNKEKEKHWADEYIERAKTYGIMSGDPDGNFRPNDPCTRGELACALVRLYEKLSQKE